MADGIHLLLKIFEYNKMARACAMKALDYSTFGDDGVNSCNVFVENGGIKYLFSAFMKKKFKSYKQQSRSFSEAEDEERRPGRE